MDSSSHQSPLPQPDPSSPLRQRTGIRRAAIGANVLLQTLLVAAIVLMVNYFNFRHFKRWDLSRNQKYALAPLTKNLLGTLKKPVKAIVFFPSASAIALDVSTLLREYEYASDRKLSMEVVDPYRNLQRARELSEKYKFGNNDNIVILDIEGRTKFINAADMAELDSSSTLFAQNPAVRAFKGEEALTSALLELLEDKQKKVYFLSGHGETPPNAEELSSLKAYLERQNLLLQALNLNNSEAVPTDASAVVLLSPRTDLSERDLKLLDDYWNERNGRLLLLLGGNLKTPRLAQWLASLGVTLNQDVVVKAGTMLTLQDGKPVLREGIATTAVGFTPPQSKPILKDIAELDMELAGMSQSMDVDPAKTAPAKIRAIQLLATTADFWGETEYVAAANPPAVKDAQKDHLGPLTLGVALEHGALQDARMKVDTGRMILIGNSAFVSNDGLRRSDLGGDFAVYSLNWLLNREELAGIPPKPKQALTLSLSERQMDSLALAVLGIIPCTVALLGALVWWRRQN